VLALLERYGLDIARELTTNGVLMSSEGTLYPLLARLREASWVSTSWQESTEGPPLRYYSLTEEGAAALEEFKAAWTGFPGRAGHRARQFEGDLMTQQPHTVHPLVARYIHDLDVLLASTRSSGPRWSRGCASTSRPR